MIKLREEGSIDSILEMFEGVTVTEEEAISFRDDVMANPTIMFGPTQSSVLRNLIKAIEEEDHLWLCVFLSIVGESVALLMVGESLMDMIGGTDGPEDDIISELLR